MSGQVEVVQKSALSITTDYGNGRIETISIQWQDDGTTTYDFAEKCKQLMLAIGYLPEQVKECFK